MKLALIVLLVIGAVVQSQAQILIPRYNLLQRLGYGYDQIGLGQMGMGQMGMGQMGMGQMGMGPMSVSPIDLSSLGQYAYNPLGQMGLPVGPLAYRRLALMGLNPLSVAVPVQTQVVTSQVVPQQSYQTQQVVSHIVQPQLQQQVVSHVVRTPVVVPSLMAPTRFGTLFGKRAVEGLPVNMTLCQYSTVGSKLVCSGVLHNFECEVAANMSQFDNFNHKLENVRMVPENWTWNQWSVRNETDQVEQVQRIDLVNGENEQTVGDYTVNHDGKNVTVSFYTGEINVDNGLLIKDEKCWKNLETLVMLRPELLRLVVELRGEF